MTCPNCGAEMTYSPNGLSADYSCPNCGGSSNEDGTQDSEYGKNPT